MNRIVEPGNPLAPGTRATGALHELTVQPVILVGDSGTRPWPLSRERNSKRLAGPMDDRWRLEATLRWLDDAFDSAAHDAARTRPSAAPLVVCRDEPRLPALERVERRYRKPARLLLEPMARNTAPALSVAALAARASAVAGDDPILVVLPTDHPSADHTAFGAALNEALAHASRGAIVAFGVPPQRAAIGYSYIRTDAPLGNRGARTIERFVEKPDAELAERYFAAGEYWWNCGMFVVRASVWLDAIGLCRPLIAAACKDAFAGASIDDAGAVHLARDAFAACPSDSVDHAVMERIGTDARLLGVTVPLGEGWPDVAAPRRVNAAQADKPADEARSPSFDERRFRHALSRFATGVVVISTGSGDSLHAMTANAFMSGSLKPPLIVVSVGHRARMHARLMDAELFGVSVLSEAQESHSRHFAGEAQSRLTPTCAPRFAAVDGLAGVVLLEHAAARFAARVVDRHPCGDHTLFVGEVLVFSLDEHAPLLFFGGRYASVAASASNEDSA
ncbi:mannose-1-phosphate guanylyltransferase/flavin reductase (DIM6/NTAB) family NADH-FMN oxidoreductase RutF [Paraburkholderia youngii]|uniref:Flavin reductase like domain-containing protein n=1 Tax=Paraburkholderia youngii TaxID=2782701 RepID=A0A7Y6K0V3_9BURK|nr:hypothetical protein [Paraburkholderia youngii]